MHEHRGEHSSKSEEKHSHGDLSELRALSRKRLVMVAALSGAFMIGEVIVGFLTQSLAILADAGHMLGDVAAVILALIANIFATKSATSEKTYGYYRAEILASTLNALCMLGMSAFILHEAYQRFFHEAEVPGIPMILIGAAGAVVNLISMRLLSADAKNSLNTKAAYLEVMSDMLASLGVVIAGIVILTTQQNVADSIVSVLIAIGLLPRTWSLLMQCVHVLMEGTPDHIAMNELRTSILAVDGVQDLHDLHVWTITSGLDAMSGHVLVRENVNTQQILNRIAEICEHDYKINHTTIQVESVQCDSMQCH